MGSFRPRFLDLRIWGKYEETSLIFFLNSLITGYSDYLSRVSRFFFDNLFGNSGISLKPWYGGGGGSSSPARKDLWLSFVIGRGKITNAPPFTRDQDATPMQPAAIFLPFNPRSDWLLISPSSITVDSNIKVMRTREMITHQRSIWFRTSSTTTGNTYRTVWRICILMPGCKLLTEDWNVRCK